MGSGGIAREEIRALPIFHRGLFFFFFSARARMLDSLFGGGGVGQCERMVNVSPTRYWWDTLQSLLMVQLKVGHKERDYCQEIVGLWSR